VLARPQLLIEDDDVGRKSTVNPSGKVARLAFAPMDAELDAVP
jgi:hypothetical protein